jgi:hypothetical protein
MNPLRGRALASQTLSAEGLLNDSMFAKSPDLMRGVDVNLRIAEKFVSWMKSWYVNSQESV